MIGIKKQKNISANEFLGIKDIRNNFLYTLDNQVLIYIKVYARNIKLLSNKEQENLVKMMTAELSSEQDNFKIYINNKNVDVSRNIENTNKILEDTNDIKKKDILKRYIKDIYEISARGKANEIEICLIFPGEYKDDIENDLLKKANEYILKFSNINYKAEILSEKEIIQLCNIFINETYAYNEDSDYIYSPPKLNNAFVENYDCNVKDNKKGELF